MDVAVCPHPARATASQDGCPLCYLERLRHEEEAARWPAEWHRRWEWQRAVLCPVCSGPRLLILASGVRACEDCGYRW